MKSTLDYLRAEMAMAQSAGETKAFVSAPELQSVLHKIAQLEKEKEFRKEGKPKSAGFIQGSNLRALIEGKKKYVSMRRKKTDICTTQLFFIEIEDPHPSTEQ